MHKINLIFATDLNGLFGVDNVLPWCNEKALLEDLRHFNRTTLDSFEKNVIVSGRKTFESLPSKLVGRLHVVLSSNDYHVNPCEESSTYRFKGLSELINNLHIFRPEQKIFIIGGAKLIEKVFVKYFNLVDNIYYTQINQKIDLGSRNVNVVHFDMNILNDMKKYIVRTNEYSEALTFFHMKVPEHPEFQYLKVMKKCLSQIPRQTRNATTYSMFNETISFDLTEGFPLLTTKKVFMRGIFEELIFFLKGQTNSKLLENKSVNIWKPNTTKEFIDKCKLPYDEGDMGPMYGYVWKHFGAEYENCHTNYEGKGYNQIEYVMNLLKNEPMSRRIIMTTYNPADAGKGVLYPCHSIVIQFYCENRNDKKYISMNMYQRSVDVACGLPFNIASNALLLHLICNTINTFSNSQEYVPHMLNIILGDIHIYEQHLEGAKEQIKRLPMNFSTIKFNKVRVNLEDYVWEDIEIQNYVSHPAIKYEMIA